MARPLRGPLIAWLLVVLVFIDVWFYPVASDFSRGMLAVLSIAVGAGALALLYRFVVVRIVSVAVAVLVLAVAVGPNRRSVDTERLRRRTVASLVSYVGTTYTWGGENFVGIDCSGLIRRGLIEALFEEGVFTANPGMLRASFWFRWHDASACAIEQRYGHDTRRLFVANSIRAVDSTRLIPGDFAVTTDGVHTLGYLGSGTWVSADSDVKRVIELRPTDDNRWLDVPITLLRWTWLESKDR